MGKRWTEEEIKILKKEYPKNGSKIPELSTRTIYAIRKKAQKMNIEFEGHNANFINESGNRYGRLKVLGLKNDYDPRLGAKWRCKCDCGNIKFVTGGNLRNGSTKSCGCLAIETTKALNKKRTLPNNQSFFHQTLLLCKRSASRRNISWNLSDSQFAQLTKGKCFYCGIPPRQSLKAPQGRDYKYNGIDRINNEKGYEWENVVPCCGKCNKLKKDKSISEFINLLEKKIAYYEIVLSNIKETE